MRTFNKPSSVENIHAFADKKLDGLAGDETDHAETVSEKLQEHSCLATYR